MSMLDHVSTSPQELEAFIERVREMYQSLEEAIKPVDAKIEELEQDWEPRHGAFWAPILRDLPAIRQATKAFLQLFKRERGADEEIPIIMSVASISYTSDIHLINQELEEAGILLTAARGGSVFIESTSSKVEQQIRERQRLKRALEKLSNAVHKAADEGREKLSGAVEEQRKLLAPARKRRRAADQTDQEEGGANE